MRRSKSTPPPEPTPAKPGGKGRPTPTRKEAEAAARARAKTPRTRKEQVAAQRLSRSESSQKMREAMRTGDERYLPARDRGPMRRFIRDYVDSRLRISEVIFILVLVSLPFLLGAGGTRPAQVANTIILGVFLLVIVDVVALRFRLRRELRRRFPEESLKGTTYYAVVRATQLRFMRLPKSQVRIGQELPDTYR